jgi:hypothetical protein
MASMGNMYRSCMAHQCQDLLQALSILPVHDHELPLQVIQLLLSSSHSCSHVFLHTDQALVLQACRQSKHGHLQKQ